MKLSRLIGARTIITQYAKEKLPAQTAYKFVKFLKTTDADEAFYNEKLRDIINQYAQKDEFGNFVQNDSGIVLVPETAAVCKSEIQELDNTIIEMPAKFSIQELSGLCLSMADILMIEELLIEENDIDGN